MAKKVDDQALVTPEDVSPEKAFEAAWAEDQKIRAVLTKTGLVRSGLRPSQIAQAKEIKEKYGL